jgi:hypothetical protein
MYPLTALQLQCEAQYPSENSSALIPPFFFPSGEGWMWNYCTLFWFLCCFKEGWVFFGISCYYLVSLGSFPLKTLLKAIKEDLSKQKDIPYSWITLLNIVKMAICSKLFYRFIQIHIKILIKFLQKLAKGY